MRLFLCLAFGLAMTLSADVVSRKPCAQTVTLAWDASFDPTVTGYNTYYGSASGAYTNRTDAGNVTAVTISNLLCGVTYYFAVTAYNAGGLESDLSNEVAYMVPTPPDAPTNLTPTPLGQPPAPTTLTVAAPN